MASYVVNNRTGEVHESDCPRVKVIHSKSPWDPAKAALTVGVYADKICLPMGLPLRSPSPPAGLTVDERTSLGCRCVYLDGEGQHHAQCPVPVVELILARRSATHDG